MEPGRVGPVSGCEQFALNIKLIIQSMKNKEIYLTLVFFILTGFINPDFGDLMFYFLLDDCKLSQDQYDFLNIMQSVGIIIGIIIYMNYLQNFEVKKLIFTCYSLQMLFSLVSLANVNRLNLRWGISDFYLNLVLMLLQKAVLTSLCILPITIMMMQVIPKNIEASMFAVISATINYSMEWGGDITGAFVCRHFGITTLNKTNLHSAVELKLQMLAIVVILTQILPKNQELFILGKKMNNVSENQEEQEDQGSAENYADEIKNYLSSRDCSYLGEN